MRSKSGPGGYLCHYGLCELAQRQAVLLRQDNPSGRAIKSYRAKVVMTAGCISETANITTYIYDTRERYPTRQIKIYRISSANFLTLPAISSAPVISETTQTVSAPAPRTWVILCSLIPPIATKGKAACSLA